MLANVHLIIVIAVVHHTLGDGSRRVLTVGQHSDFGSTLYQGAVELHPRAPRERHDAQVVIGHHQSVGQELQGVERWINRNLSLRHLALDGVGKTKEQRVATGEDDDALCRTSGVSGEDAIKGYGDVYPLRPFGQQRCHYLMMALAA